jgi:hypothetical protein
MSFYKKFLLLIFFLSFFSQVSFADDTDQPNVAEEELPLNNPFQGNTGSNSSENLAAVTPEELENKFSLYKYKLVGLISGKSESYISLANEDGNILILQLNEDLYKGLKLVDLRLKEAIFKKDDGTYLTINFNNQITESNEY